MSIILDGTTYDYPDGQYTPGFNRLFDTKRTISGSLARVDTNVLERTYTFTLYLSLAQWDKLLASFTKTGTIVFIDDRGVSYTAYFMSPLAPKMLNPLGFNKCNQFTVDVTLMVNGQN